MAITPIIFEGVTRTQDDLLFYTPHDENYDLGLLPIVDHDAPAPDEGEEPAHYNDFYAYHFCLFLGETGAGLRNSNGTITAKLKNADGENLAVFAVTLNYDYTTNTSGGTYTRYLTLGEYSQTNPALPVLSGAKNPFVRIENNYKSIDGEGPASGGCTLYFPAFQLQTTGVGSPWHELPLHTPFSVEVSWTGFPNLGEVGPNGVVRSIDVGLALSAKPLPYWRATPGTISTMEPVPDHDGYLRNGNPALTSGATISEMAYYVRGDKENDAFYKKPIALPVSSNPIFIELDDKECDIYITALDSDGLRGWQKISLHGLEKDTVSIVMLADGTRLMARSEGDDEHTGADKHIVLRRLHVGDSQGAQVGILNSRALPRLTMEPDGTLLLSNRNEATKTFEVSYSSKAGKEWF